MKLWYTFRAAIITLHSAVVLERIRGSYQRCTSGPAASPVRSGPVRFGSTRRPGPADITCDTNVQSSARIIVGTLATRCRGISEAQLNWKTYFHDAELSPFHAVFQYHTNNKWNINIKARPLHSKQKKTKMVLKNHLRVSMSSITCPPPPFPRPAQCFGQNRATNCCNNRECVWHVQYLLSYTPAEALSAQIAVGTDWELYFLRYLLAFHRVV